MSEQQSKRTEADDASRVDHLLNLLGSLSPQDPSSALRERLAELAQQRLSEEPVSILDFGGRRRRPLTWLKLVLAVSFAIAIGLSIPLVIHFGRQELAPAERAAKTVPPSLSARGEAAVPSVRPSKARVPRTLHPRPTLIKPRETPQMVLRLPYSNSAIQTGTDTTIRVSMSQSELLSLGFPINTTVADTRIVAELTLGADGLPRAISLPLPLEVVKEKK
jgi:hypothetical protein